MIKVWLDDVRPSPVGWIWVKSADDAIKLVATGEVLALSLDHDLGDVKTKSGGDVLRWLEEQVFDRRFAPPIVEIHTMNPVARSWMLKVARKINERQSGEI